MKNNINLVLVCRGFSFCSYNKFSEKFRIQFSLSLDVLINFFLTKGSVLQSR